MSSVTKGWILNLSTALKKSFQYNPTFFDYSRGATYAEISSPGMPYPNLQYVKGNGSSFSVSLFFYNNPNTGVIKTWINFLNTFLPPEVNVKGYKKPPEMLFCYGYFIRKCVLENLNVGIERYDKKGNPIQATLTLQLRQVGI